jgi:GH24 family phage-related lysozyme (muramidase)
MTALTPRIVAYCCRMEGIVTEAYLDDARPPVWTWSGGITAAAGVDVMAYKDRPADLETCLRAVIGCMQAQYLPEVLHAVTRSMSEVQLAAALSFHWHYGAIATAQWVRDWNAGNVARARDNFLQWTDHGKALERAKAEQQMFFDGKWPTDLRVPVYAVAKPSYKPMRAVLTDVLPLLTSIMGEG